jgi:hypothetical protein
MLVYFVRHGVSLCADMLRRDTAGLSYTAADVVAVLFHIDLLYHYHATISKRSITSNCSV